MLVNNNTEKLIGLQDVTVKKVIQGECLTIIYIELDRKSQICPCCGQTTNVIHDYREQTIKDIPAFGKHVLIKYRKRRFRCACGKKFAEKNTFFPKYHRMTNRLATYVIDCLRETVSFSSVAKTLNLSVTTVIRIFNLVQYPKPRLSRLLSIDEFKGNTNSEKYQYIIADPENHVVLDILPKRYV